MKTKYFTVNEACPNDEEFIHLGTISANSTEELRKKLKDAVGEHFDTADEWIEDTSEVEADFENPYNQRLTYMVDENEECIIIRETWIY